MNIIDEIDNLPDYMDCEDLKSWFYKLINLYNSEEIGKKETIEGLWNLSDRQWHTYKYVDSDLKLNITKLLLDNWEETSDYIDSICGIVGMLGLENVYSKIKELKNKKIDTKLKELVDKIIHEFGESVSDPYQSFK